MDLEKNPYSYNIKYLKKFFIESEANCTFSFEKALENLLNDSEIMNSGIAKDKYINTLVFVMLMVKNRA